MANYCLKTGKSPQKTREFFTSAQGLPSNKVTALAMDSKGKTYIGTDSGLCFYDGKKTQLLDIKGGVTMLYADIAGAVWAGIGTSLYKLNGGKVVFSQDIDSEAVGMDADYSGSVWLVTQNILYKYSGEKFAEYKNLDAKPAKALAAVNDGGVYVAVPFTLLSLFGKRPMLTGIHPDNSGMPSWTINALAADDYNGLWVGTDKGLCVYDCKSEWLTYDNTEYLIKADITALTLGKNGAVYVGTKIGLYVYDGVKRHFLGCERWIPDEEVLSLAVSPDGNEIWVGTNKGVSRITIKMMSLKEKADFYQEQVEKYNVRNSAYIMHRELSEKGNKESGHVHISDNDGLWTATHMLAQTMRYGATKDKEALELARRSKNALIKLLDITGLDGFVSRAFRRPGEIGFGNGDPEWHLVKDEIGELEWKCETSSDEISGHFYGFSYYYDICADKKEKEEIKTFLCKIMDHILRNNYNLVDYDGKPTTWAHWGPDALNLNDKWCWEKNINSLEVLSYLKTAWHVSGDEKYQNEYLRLIKDHHYALNCLQYKLLDDNDCHIDDHLGFIVIPMLIRYEDDPAIKRYYLMGLKHHWESQRIERSPYWNVIYGALTGEHCDLENAVQSLEEIPLDLVTWNVINSKRQELVHVKAHEKFGGATQLSEPVPYDEKHLNNYDGNPFTIDSLNNGRRFYDATNIFLAPYWIARYYGLIEE